MRERDESEASTSPELIDDDISVDPVSVDQLRFNFEEALSILRCCFGLNLSLIEQMRLRECVDELAEDFMRSNSEYRENRFEIIGESIARFLFHFYDVPPSYKDTVERIREGFIYSCDEAFLDELKLRQEFYHHGTHETPRPYP